jgi:hypothetical protein
MRSVFGWDLPPGVTSSDIDRAYGAEGTCVVCGNAGDACICPECPVCGEIGRIACYAVTKNEWVEHKPRMARPGEKTHWGRGRLLDSAGVMVQPYDADKQHHGLLLTRAQVMARYETRIRDLQQQIDNERQAIEWIKSLPDEQLTPVAGAEVLNMRRVGE